MDILIKVLQFIFSFSLLIFIHELGHFMFARMFGIRVDKFFIFFNPGFSLYKKKIGDTEYGIGWIPFGGYVKIAGMIDESMDTEQMSKPAQPDEFRSKPAWQRLLVMLGGVIMNVVLAIFIYVGISWYYGNEYIANEDLKFGWVFSDLGQELGFRNGDKILSIDGKEFEDAFMVFHEIILAKSPEVKFLRDGMEMTIKIPENAKPRLLDDPSFMQWRIPFVVAGLIEDGGAHKAGIAIGDSLVAVDGIPMVYFDQYSEYIGQRGGQEVELSVIRTTEDDEKRLVTMEVQLSEDGKLGVYPHNIRRYVPIHTTNYGFLGSIPAGLKLTGDQIASYGRQLKLIFSPKTEAYKSLGGPIAIFNVFPSYWNWEGFWKLTALLSLILAVMNILPIPGLDGGHVMFVLYEIIARRKPGERFMEYATLCGLLFIVSLMLFATSNDIYRFFIK